MQHSRLVTTLMMRQYTGQPVAAGVEEAEATVEPGPGHNVARGRGHSPR